MKGQEIERSIMTMLYVALLSLARSLAAWRGRSIIVTEQAQHSSMNMEHVDHDDDDRSIVQYHHDN
jgi:hypothetical protein